MTVGGAIGEVGDIGKLLIGAARTEENGEATGAGVGAKMEGGLTGGKAGAGLVTVIAGAIGLMKSLHG